MAGKLFKLYTLPASFYLEDAPVIISEGSLNLNCRSEDLSVCLRMKSVSEHEISSVSVRIKLYDAKGAPAGEDIQYSYPLLKLKRDDEFGTKKCIDIPEKRARSFSVYVSQVVFSDYSQWENSEPFIPVGKAVSLDYALKDEETAKQFSARYGNDCRFMPYIDRDLWFCTCGAVNTIDEEKCHSCKRNRNAFQSINVGALASEAKKRKERDQEEAEIKKAEKERKQKKTKKILKWAMVILPILIVIAVVIATVPPFLARRESYVSAGTLLEERRFDEAREAYASLGDYLNSAEMAEQGVLYEKAVFIMKCAEQNDEAALSLVDIDDELAKSDNLQMALYGKAKELLEGIKDYKDSSDKIEKIDAVFSDYNEGLLQDAYNSAIEKLDSNEYLGAVTAFSELGNYKNAAEMVSESFYKRASVLLDFCEKNNVRDIYAKFSSEEDTDSIISMPASALTRMGEAAFASLKACCGKDGIEFLYEDTPSAEGLAPICDAVASEFKALGGYKDSADFAVKAEETGNFSLEFFALLKEGKLKSALTWLDTYNDQFPDRDNYYDWIEAYLPYCDAWVLDKGDSSLIPYSAGKENVQATSFTPKIFIENGKVTMIIKSEDDSFTVEMISELGKVNFQTVTDEYSFYYAVINQLDHFTYLRYSADGKVMSSCEYKRAG